MPDIDLATMSDTDIEEYARQQIAECGVPGEDPAGLVQALKNMAARDKALSDPYWRDLVNQEAAEIRMRGTPPVAG
ncbi:hypothetical protein R3Q06_22960 [Rhodococcus erythropolis]|uniref:hypothetical protein n=1 Tax=Rhodococcus erythropolis TaxID=1833 RepID=UPI002948F753|nr:hypothetical protein [Rhodococcus erythropolis]MDV6276363.1 hypothetical protein [Rhodococcus erythropolis]